MSDPKTSIGCFGLLMVAMFLGALAWAFWIFTSLVATEQRAEAAAKAEDAARRAHHSQKLTERTESSEGEDFTTMDAQLVLAQEKKQTITQIRLEGTPTPLDGSWVVKEVGYDVVVLEGAAGLLTLRMESIVGILVGPEKPKKAPATIPEIEVEK